MLINTVQEFSRYYPCGHGKEVVKVHFLNERIHKTVIRCAAAMHTTFLKAQDTEAVSNGHPNLIAHFPQKAEGRTCAYQK